MLTREMIAILEKQPLGFVATVPANGRPNLSPKGTLILYKEPRVSSEARGSCVQITQVIF